MIPVLLAFLWAAPPPAAAGDDAADIAVALVEAEGRFNAFRARFTADEAEIRRMYDSLGPGAAAFADRESCREDARFLAMREGFAPPVGDAAGDRVEALIDRILGRLMRTNGVAIPGLCRTLLIPGVDSLQSVSEMRLLDLSPKDDLRAQAAGRFALAKFIKVWTSAIARSPDDSAFAAILAHELAHLSLEHAQSQVRYDYKLAAAYGEDAREALSDVLVQEQEREADRRAVIYLARAGYDPTGMRRELELALQDDPRSDALRARVRALEGASLGPPLASGPAEKPPLLLGRLKALLPRTAAYARAKALAVGLSP